MRVRCYVETHHELEDKALTDLARFLAMEPPPLPESGANAPPR
jgi:hypothetical protein